MEIRLEDRLQHRFKEPAPPGRPRSGRELFILPLLQSWVGMFGSVMELRWSAWSFGVMMPVGPDTVGLLGVFAWRGPADGGVEVSGFGDAATAFGFDLLSPGDADPVAGAAAGGELPV